MAQTSFADRLARIEQQQYIPAKDRLLAGISEEQEREAAGKPAKAARKARAASRPGSSPILRIVAGFVLMFTAVSVLAEMNGIRAMIEASEGLAPLVTPIMAAIAGTMVVIMLFFAVKLNLAAFRVLSQPWRLPFAIGMVMGFAVGLGPTEFAEGMMAQLPIG